MARNFVRANSERLWVEPGSYYTSQLSFAVRVRLASLPGASTFHSVFTLANGTGAGDRRNLHLDYRNFGGSSKWQVGWTSSSGAVYASYDHVVTPSTATWYTLTGSVDWTQNPDAVLLEINGSNAALTQSSGTNNLTPDSAGTARLTLGALWSNNNATDHWNGDIAEFALWNAVLTAGEKAAYAAGASPAFIRPASRISYVPLLGGINDRVLGALTDVNTTSDADHPPVIYPTAPRRFTVASAPATAPEITVTGNGVGITDGDNTPSATDHTDFGTTPEGTTKPRTFTITNDGDADLVISSVALSGADAAEFDITTDPTGTIAPAGTGTLVVTALATTQGSFTATVTINSNDANEAAFNFDIAVEVTEPLAGTGAGGGTLFGALNAMQSHPRTNLYRRKRR